MQVFEFFNKGSKLDLKEMCDGLSWRPSLFVRSRLPKAREYDLNVGFVRQDFSDSKNFTAVVDQIGHKIILVFYWR